MAHTRLEQTSPGREAHLTREPHFRLFGPYSPAAPAHTTPVESRAYRYVRAFVHLNSAPVWCSTGELYYPQWGILLNAMSSTLLIPVPRVPTILSAMSWSSSTPDLSISPNVSAAGHFTRSGPLACWYKNKGVPPLAPGQKDPIAMCECASWEVCRLL